MDIRVQSGAIQDVASDLIVVNLFQGVEHPGVLPAPWMPPWVALSAS